MKRSTLLLSIVLLLPLATPLGRGNTQIARAANGNTSNAVVDAVRNRRYVGEIRKSYCPCNPMSGLPLVGVYNANDPADVLRFNTWLGRPADIVQLDGGRSNWVDWQQSLDWLADRFANASVAIRWSVPLIPNGATLEEAAVGTYNDKYKALAQQFVRHFGQSAVINIRLGWEFNGAGWNPWSAVGKALQYKSAYGQFVAVFRRVASNFAFEWTPNIGEVGMNPEDAYPGDDFVDLIGMDFYYNIAWDSGDPLQAWHHFVLERYGLQWHQDFAAAHHKPTAYAEWGVNTNAAGPFILLAAEWFRTHHVVYQSYWNSNSEFAGRLSDDQYPNAGAAYKLAFASSQCGVPKK